MSDFYLLWQRKRQTIITIVVLSLIITVGATLAQTFKYGSQSKMLVVEKFPAGTDIYAISRSQEYLSALLATVVKTDSFYQQVMESGFNVDQSYFTGYPLAPPDKNKILKKWRQTISAQAIDDTGIIEIKVFHPSRYQAEQINKAIDYVLKTKHQQYHGNNNVVLAEIEAPIISDKIVKPNIPVNIAAGFFFGLTLALFYVYLFPETEYNLRLWPRRRQKKISLSAAPEPAPAPAAEHLRATVSYYNQVAASQNQAAANQPLSTAVPAPGASQEGAASAGPEVRPGEEFAAEIDLADSAGQRPAPADLKGSMENILG